MQIVYNATTILYLATQLKFYNILIAEHHQ